MWWAAAPLGPSQRLVPMSPRDDFPHDVSVVVVAHNAKPALWTTIESVLAAGCPPPQITIVDVASSAGSVEEATRRVPQIRLRRLEVNRGPNPGRNIGLREAPTPYVFLMDADVIVDPQTVQRLRAAVDEDPAIAVGSPVVVHRDRPHLIQYADTGFHFICEAVNPYLDRPLAERGDAPKNIGTASASALLIARDAAIAVGLFDERYFMGKDDGDFTHRLVMAGHRIVELPQALVRHGSRPRGAWLFYYQIRNRWHVILKDYQVRTIVLLLPVLAVHELLQATLLLLTGHGLTYVKALGGLLAMLPSLPADRAAVARFRKLADRDLLRSDPIVARDDFIRHPALRTGKRLYEHLLTSYWKLIRPLLPSLRPDPRSQPPQ